MRFTILHLSSFSLLTSRTRKEERALASRTLLLDPRQREVDQIRENQQKRGKCKCLAELAFTRLKDDCGRQYTRLPADIPSDHHRGTHFRDHGAKSSHQGSQEGQPRLPPQVPDHLSA